MSTSTPPFFKGAPPTPSAGSGTRTGTPWYRKPLHLIALVVVLAAVGALVVLSSPEPSQQNGAEPSSNPYDRAYGTFDPIQRSGTGDDRIGLPAAATAGIITAQAEGPGRLYIQFSTESGELAVSWPDISWKGAPTPYSGILVYGLDLAGSTPGWLNVRSGGPWSLTIEPISAAEELAASARGTDDAVYVYSGEAATWTVRVRSRHEWAVRQWQIGSTSGLSLVSGKGSYRGRVGSLDGPSVVAIHADRHWVITR